VSVLRSQRYWAGGVRLHYALGGAGPTVVLLHGFPETHVSWSLQIPVLIAAGYRVAALDLRGYGASERPRAGYDLDTLASDVAALIDELGVERAHVIGHDWGGAITWQLAAHRPHRLEHAIVLGCPHPEAMLRELSSNARQLARSWYMFFFQLPLLPEFWLTRRSGKNLERMFRAESTAAPPEIVQAERRALLAPGAARAALAYYRTAARSGLRELALRDAARHPRVDLPVSLIWGENDSALGLELIERSKRFAPELDAHVIAGAGHFVHQERPEQVNQLLLDALANHRRKP
jgi:epoxide hydrolase 4